MDKKRLDFISRKLQPEASMEKRRFSDEYFWWYYRFVKYSSNRFYAHDGVGKVATTLN